MRNIVLVIVILMNTLFARDWDFTMVCKVSGKDITYHSIWEISNDKVTLVYYDAYLYYMGEECSFYHKQTKITPIATANGIMAFSRIKSIPAKQTTRNHSNLAPLESDLGFPAFRVASKETYIEKYNRDMHELFYGIVNGLNISNSQYIMPGYAFNSINFPKAIKENAVNVCGEGWTYFGNARQQERVAECVPRGKEYGVLYSVVTNSTGAQMVLYYGTKEKRRFARDGWALVNEYGEFMGFKE
jgi:hypothetical protein